MTDIIKKFMKTVSFSQFSNWYTCEFKYFLDYIKGLKTFEDTLNMSFGTAMHRTLQTYLKAYYYKSEKHAKKMDMFKFFQKIFLKEVTKKRLVYEKKEYDEFVSDGKEIIKTFSHISTQLKYFPRDKYLLLDIEHKIEQNIINNVRIQAFLDIVLKEKSTGKIKILDLKTSTNAWTNYQKNDFTKTSQLVLYKSLYSRKYNIPLSMIDVEFFILRRKLYENANFPQSHIQVFKPNSSLTEITNVIDEFKKFVKNCFTEDGQYRLDVKYHKIPGKNHKNCKYCPYYQKKCNAVPDLKE